MLKFYGYKGCGTCRKAKKFLDENGVAYEEIAIRETPPQRGEFETMLGAYDGELKRLFNTSGGDYKSMNMKDKLPGLCTEEACELLGSNGNLVKRPFLIGDGVALVGFKEDEWREALLS
ncbi:arsenate reductase family protein [Ruficoccus sp. ZRK36]|uniref:arsenate reductase family protein n=1 Tax=Ruficoccus sp. ZRK36 TaxID=2866311 RepID=UPI001C7362F7|nr:arsenate reductase family protein [Ruficoccus sp. ZRK36]QYY34547.1 arsenate reductase family protein [Ruficoccus sp. ZRK36]